MPAVVRIGDSVTCGDHSAQGSGNVFAGGMPITNTSKNKTLGHGCFPPTVFLGPWSSSVFVNNQQVALKGVTKIAQHVCGKNRHDGIASSGASTVFVES